jgi:phosphoribosylformylglycinamidine synthase
MINNEPSHIKKARDGDLIVMTGGRIGKDGIHGATFSSEELHELSPTSAVQIGDPITQKKMYDFLLEARDLGLYNAITDNGAGGLSSSVGEMAQLSGGCELHLDRAPLKYAGLDPWEILLSESQERMTLAVPPEKIDQFLDLAKKRGVEATVLGKFTSSGKFHVLYKGRTVAYLDMEFLHSGLPQMKLEAIWMPVKQSEPNIPPPGNLTEVLKQMLSRLNICSKEYVVRQYDHEVQGGSVIKPLVGIDNDGPSDAAVVRPLLDSYQGVVIANGINPRYGDIDTYHMAACAIDEAIRNAIAVGANFNCIALNDNFCWPSPIYDPEKNPDGKYKLAQLVRANMALYDYTVAYNTPCISGKDSMSIDYKYKDEKGVERKISGPPTLLITAIGKIEDVRKAVSMDVKAPGDLVYILGMTRLELGGSEYYAMFGYIGNSVPKVEAITAKNLYRALNKAMDRELIESCHDVSNGGIAVALAESAFAGGFGMEIDLRKVPVEGIKRDDYILFSESQSRFIVTVAPENQVEFESIMAGNIYACIGKVCESEEFKVIGVNGDVIIYANIRELKEAWQSTLKW